MAESLIERANKQAYRTGGAGKGDLPRPIDKRIYDRNYLKIFRPKKRELKQT